MKPGYLTSEFWLVVACTGFAMWAGGMALLDPAIELERLLAILAGVSGIAGFYTQRRTALKKENGNSVPINGG